MIEIVHPKEGSVQPPAFPSEENLLCELPHGEAVLFYVGSDFAGWEATPLSNPFRPLEVGGIKESLALYDNFLRDTISSGEGEAYEMLVAISVTSRIGRAQLATFYQGGKSNANLIIDTIRRLQDGR